MEEFEFFWNGPFSQWYSSPFVIDGVKYNCAEQYMMAEKARVFKDKESERKIMKTKMPGEQKALGRKVKNFNVDKWNNVAKDIVYRASMAKFTQDEELKQILLDTGDRTLVEASPYDKIWGIGLHETDPYCLNRATWKGKNWLGEVLTQVKNDIRKQEVDNETEGSTEVN